MTDEKKTSWWREGAGPDEVADSIFKRVGLDPRVGGFVRDLGDGREVHCVVELYYFRVSIGPVGGDAWTAAWWYGPEDREAVLAAFNAWDGEGDAPGPWIRTTHGASGGYRARSRD